MQSMSSKLLEMHLRSSMFGGSVTEQIKSMPTLKRNVRQPLLKNNIFVIPLISTEISIIKNMGT